MDLMMYACVYMLVCVCVGEMKGSNDTGGGREELGIFCY